MWATILLAAIFVLPPQKSDAVIGLAAIHLESGRVLSVRPTERFPMGSVYKFPIALTVLRRVDTGLLSLDREITIEPKDFAPGWSPLRHAAHGKPITLSIRELLRHMVSISDNTASDALLHLVGGPTAVTTRMAELGMSGIRIDRSEKEMARDLKAPGGVERYAIDVRDTATPEGMAALLVAFWRGRVGLSEKSHALLVDLMTNTTTGPRRIRSAVPRGAVVAHKTGTMPGTVNDAAIVTTPEGEHIALVVLTKRGSVLSFEQQEDDLAAAARKAYDEILRSR